jgi:hypothetical protein
MVQNMIRNDPQFANNPMLQTMMEELGRNPQMAAQMSQMMRDPEVVRQIEQARAMQTLGQQANSTSPSIPGSNTNASDPAAISRMAQMMQMMQQTGNMGGAGVPSNQQNNSGGQGSGQDDAEMTEEEMIAEAIRRSLQDGN